MINTSYQNDHIARNVKYNYACFLENGFYFYFSTNLRQNGQGILKLWWNKRTNRQTKINVFSLVLIIHDCIKNLKFSPLCSYLS